MQAPAEPEADTAGPLCRHLWSQAQAGGGGGGGWALKAGEKRICVSDSVSGYSTLQVKEGQTQAANSGRWARGRGGGRASVCMPEYAGYMEPGQHH